MRGKGVIFVTWEQAKDAMVREFGLECEATIALFRDAERFGKLDELPIEAAKTCYEVRKLQAEMEMFIDQIEI